jgi:hypothetical protein
MAKKQSPPITALKHDFYLSLDAFMQATLNLYQAIDIVKDDLRPEVKAIMEKRMTEWKDTWSRDAED